MPSPKKSSAPSDTSGGAFGRPELGAEGIELQSPPPPPARPRTLAESMTETLGADVSPEAIAAASRIGSAATPPTRKYSLGSRNDAEDITTPSGETARVRRIGIDGLVRAGVVHSLDQLTRIVSSDIINPAEGKPPEAAQTEEQEIAAYIEMMHVVDRVCCYCILEPKTYMEPNNPYDKDPDKTYTGDILPSDRFFIFQFAIGGSRDLAAFLEEFGPLGSLDSLQNVAMSS